MLLSSFKKNILGISIFFALFTVNASAAIVSKGDYVQDDKNSLDWLKVTKTQGQPYNRILQGKTQVRHGYKYGYVAGDYRSSYAGAAYPRRVNTINGKGSFEKKFHYKAMKTADIGAFLVKTSAVATVSEPASLGLFGLGLIGVAAFSRRRRLP